MHGPNYMFIFVVLFLLFSISWLIYRILKSQTDAFRSAGARWAYWLLTVSAVAVIFTNRWLYQLGVPADWFALPVLWIIAQLLTLPLLVVLLGGSWLWHKLGGGGKTSINRSRRSFLRNAFGAVPLLAFAGSARGVYNAEEQLVVQRYTLALPQLPPSLDQFRLVQISDTHVGAFFDLAKLERVLDIIRQEQPHILVITGDLIDDLELLEQTVAKLSGLHGKIPYGIYFCWGNHEYFRNIDAIRQALANSPVRVLTNQSARILDGEIPFYLAGVDYPWAREAGGQETVRREFFAEAMQDVPEKAFTVLLSHHPDFIENAFAAGIPLTLAGHTHGGQIGIFGHSLLPLSYRYMRGFYRQGQSQAYVSVGTGHWLPFRLGCPAEISVFTFQLPT
ncbi:hypothetical protein P22_3803 [Propionispora sp. 2/2-37]|uniref:metallophosphoesterase n=1 Tax=Propionispora sp. 2/2-37 TaxID=1677858 RepID=UPI0006BB73B8|nr:metallophosphoesterase [Propionispora sp. 2/2-37]CUH97668.1 hypothetical protein P22_3803 [Propionispora sp. 2/2-37]